jgi:hypothetical protein
MGAALLASLEARGAHVSLTLEEKIRVEAPEGVLDDTLRMQLRQERDGLAALLRNRQRGEDRGLKVAFFASFASAWPVDEWRTRTQRTQRTQVRTPDLRTRALFTREELTLPPVPADLPEDWREGLDRLPQLTAPTGFTEERWRVGVWWARRIAHEHGSAAFVMGWSAERLFGLYPDAPATRYDGMGLAFLMRLGEVIVSLDDDQAITRALSGAQHRVLRNHGLLTARPAWSLQTPTP